VRGHGDVVHLQEGAVLRHGLVPEHIEHGAADLLALKRVAQSLLIDKTGARGVAEDRGRLHLGKSLLANDVLGSLDQTQVDRNDVGRGQQLVKRNGLHAVCHHLLGRAVLVVCHDLGAKALDEALCDGAADSAVTVQADAEVAERCVRRVVVDIVLVPLTVENVAVAAQDTAALADHHRDRQIGDRLCQTRRAVADGNAKLLGSLDVAIFPAGAHHEHELEVLAGLEHGSGHAAEGGHQNVRVLDLLHDLGLGRDPFRAFLFHLEVVFLRVFHALMVVVGDINQFKVFKLRQLVFHCLQRVQRKFGFRIVND